MVFCGISVKVSCLKRVVHKFRKTAFPIKNDRPKSIFRKIASNKTDDLGWHLRV